MATRPEFQPSVATFKNPAPTKDLSLNLKKIQHYQPLKPISSFGLITKEQNYQLYQYRPVKKNPNGTRHGKWDEKLCLTCGELLPKECNWNNIPGRKGTCDATYQYMILICDWVRGRTLFEAVFNRALRRLQHYPHDKNELYNTTQAKVREGTAEEIRYWKESAEVANEVASYNMFDPVDEFQDYYQQLCPTQQKQKQYLAQINTYLCENCFIPCQNQCCKKCQDERDLKRKMEIENQQSQNQLINQQDSPDGPKSEKFVAYTNLKQNNSEKPYIIESKEKITQAIFLPLVKIGKFVPIENHEELLQTIRGTFGFKLTGKGIEVNFTKTIEEKSKIIKTEWFITLLSYGKSEIRIKRTIKEKDLIFEPYPKTCQQFLIGLTNLFILANKTQWIKIPIANTTEEPVYIPEDIIIEYFGMELKNMLTLQEILNFSEIALYCELTSINWQQLLKCYQFTPEELAKLNIGTMDLDQHDFRNQYWIERHHIANIIHRKQLDINWVKVKGHSGIMSNEHTNEFAKAAAFSDFCLPSSINEQFLKAGGTMVSDSSKYFVRDVF
ncbi:hypothetical protein G9A89_020433 [Geosiphon pyriformis]|nr:hypothetical protein G9A89_020433 [Geosiphon pyriformis]